MGLYIISVILVFKVVNISGNLTGQFFLRRAQHQISQKLCDHCIMDLNFSIIIFRINIQSWGIICCLCEGKSTETPQYYGFVDE